MFRSPTYAPNGQRTAIVCPPRFTITRTNNCRAPLNTNTCPAGTTATNGWRQVSPATASAGILCAPGVTPAVFQVGPAAVPQGTIRSIVFTDIVMGISLATWNANDGSTSYAMNLAVALGLPVSFIKVVATSLSRRSLQSAAARGSVSLSVTVQAPANNLAATATQIGSPVSTTTMTTFLRARGGVFSGISTQGAVMLGAPTFLPTAIPTVPVPSFSPSSVRTMPPSQLPSWVPTEDLDQPTHEPTHTNYAASAGAADSKNGGGLSVGALAGIGVGIFFVVCLALYFILSHYQKASKGKLGGQEDFYSDDIYGRRSHESNNNFAPHVRQGRNSLGAGRSSGSFSGSSPVYDSSARLSINGPSPSRASFNNQSPGYGDRRPSFSAGSALASPSRLSYGTPGKPVASYGPPPTQPLKGGVRGSFSVGPGLRTSAKHEYTL